ncbi:MAG: YraN family protein [Oscillospiraceae bacterium]|nr:YraN family protein [Oscillospiraceae bacterium]
MENHRLVGRWGEAEAAKYLRKKGYTILDAGYTTRFGEIDLIARSRSHLVFVEVKLRKNCQFVHAREYVDHRKQDRIRITAELYLAAHETQLQPRFDVIEVYAPDGTQTICPQIVHLEDAFQ